MGSEKGAAKARKIREKQVKAKIQAAIGIHLLYGKKPTVRSVAEEAQISTATAAKYLREINTKP
ncbi:hypothetical protein E0765_07865 [Sulfuricurvum sp. IAE1]|jgi:DNA-binding transcriptional regulator YhcF (GntR family)|uniref:hypothetical protein n=1 Tax=Sulfuricurvum sp. IAE1 TaxID=2546102 RepID=UPI001043F498|nr:hypothetical protein [Sulfuricurvum sp. IAE1]MDD3770004.1 hypothetical protein [Sulfuricurvum sp.]MDX9965958.1 hypothetical protein [Sulfuricurvum sp.]TDA63111.1 hypothetical protein E0765_07865 [Sulfuricurvum sp. IAE1]